MQNTLLETKKLIRDKFLGMAGIHGVGIRASENAVQVYLDPDYRPGQDEVVETIRRAVAPYKLLVIREGCAILA